MGTLQNPAPSLSQAMKARNNTLNQDKVPCHSLLPETFVVNLPPCGESRRRINNCRAERSGVISAVHLLSSLYARNEAARIRQAVFSGSLSEPGELVLFKSYTDKVTKSDI